MSNYISGRWFESSGKISMTIFVTEFLFSKLQAFKLQPLALCILKIQEISEIAYNIKFLFAEAGVNRFSTE